jgi:hypothetical protein
LVERDRSNPQGSIRTIRLWRKRFEYFRLDTYLVTRVYGTQPPQFVDAGTHDPARGPEIAVYQQAHRCRSRVPSADGQGAKYGTLGGVFIEMKRLGSNSPANAIARARSNRKRVVPAKR